jgi:hypothetical protein
MSPYTAGTGNSSMALTKQKFQADHSFQFSAQFKNTPPPGANTRDPHGEKRPMVYLLLEYERHMATWLAIHKL